MGAHKLRMRKSAVARQIDRYVGILLLCVLKPVKHWVTFEDVSDKLLLIKFAGMGDIILMKPVVDGIKRRSNLRIYFLTSRAMKEVVSYLQLSNGAIYYIDFATSFSRPLELVKTILNLRRERFRVVIDFEQWMRFSSLISYLCGAPMRYGFSTAAQFRNSLYTHSVTYSFTQHTLVSFAQLASLFLGEDIVMESLKGFVGCISPRQDEVEAMRRMLLAYGWKGDSQPLAIVHPGCGSGGEPRTWVVERYAQVVRILCDRGVFIVLTGGGDDVEIAKRVFRIAESSSVAFFVGRTSFAQLVALVSMANFVLCPNTGIMHLAAALGRPTVALHGPTNPVQWRPIGEAHRIVQSKLPCVPCLRLGHDYRCNDYKCMSAITLEEVLEAIDEICKPW